ncbi:NUT family member 2D [Sciurus carolinensis]|uniref:NUT family member 2D n=1 Tax=Sciurus carolinensis TaxID=30640 RepID=A0AA41T1N7_SCICA|nr:NUT family member 2D [Sciurus carolinensis]
MTLEEGLQRGLQECQHINNFDQMIFYEMAQKFVEFDAAEMEDPIDGKIQSQSPVILQVLQSLMLCNSESSCRQEPTITVEEGLQKGLQEWQRTSNFDRMIFYETTEKFVEFEAAEELEDPRMQLSRVFQSRPPPLPRRLDHPRPPVPNAVQQKTSLNARPAPSLAAKFKVPQTKVSETKVSQMKACETKTCETKACIIKVPKTKAPEEIPPEAIQEYEDIMDHLVGPPNFAMCKPSSSFMGQLAANLGEEELEQQPIDDDLYPDPSLLSYVDEDFVKKVETMIQPHFLNELLPSKPDINILALMKELEQEKELASGQVDRGRRVSQKTSYDRTMQDIIYKLVPGLQEVSTPWLPTTRAWSGSLGFRAGSHQLSTYSVCVTSETKAVDSAHKATAEEKQEEDDDYHWSNKQVSICLECNSSKVWDQKRKWIHCSAQATALYLKKFIAKKLNLSSFNEVTADSQAEQQGVISQLLEILLMCFSLFYFALFSHNFRNFNQKQKFFLVSPTLPGSPQEMQQRLWTAGTCSECRLETRPAP